MNRRYLSFFFVGLLALGACAQADDEAEATEAAEEPAAVEEPEMAQPDTTGAAMWAYIQEQDYQAWTRWPGLGDQYQGQEPHGATLTTYVNDIALQALEAGDAIMPAGAIVIKDNFGPDGQLAAVTTMYKAAAGYNPDHNDWFFTKHLASGELDQTPDGMAMEGRLLGCQSCHLQARDLDYLINSRPGAN